MPQPQINERDRAHCKPVPVGSLDRNSTTTMELSRRYSRLAGESLSTASRLCARAGCRRRSLTSMSHPKDADLGEFMSNVEKSGSLTGRGSLLPPARRSKSIVSLTLMHERVCGTDFQPLCLAPQSVCRCPVQPIVVNFQILGRSLPVRPSPPCRARWRGLPGRCSSFFPDAAVGTRPDGHHHVHRARRPPIRSSSSSSPRNHFQSTAMR